MPKIPTWRTLVIAGVCLFAFLSLLPNFLSPAIRDSMPSWLPSRAITLGLDLQGGSYLLLEVDIEPVYRERLETMVNDVRAALRAARIGYRGLGVQGEAVALTLTDPAQRDQALAEIEKLNQSSLSTAGRIRDFDVDDQAGSIVLRLTDAKRNELRQSAISQSLEVVRRRIDQLGTREASIQRQGADRILVQVPGEKNPENVKRLLGRTARLTFHMVDLEGSVQDALKGKVPPGDMLLESAEREGSAPTHYLIKRPVDLSGESLTDAQPSFQDNQPVVSFRLDSAGARRFGKITQENVGRPFAIVLDDKVISAPNIREPILGGSGIISGSFTVESANELSILLRAGALPAPLKVVEERSVGAELGADSIRDGTIACLVAGIMVVALMIFYYGIFGVIADVALILNVMLVLGIMSLLGSTLTLPGIAGIVLTIGTSVDSNVLVYERIREERKGGRTPLSAINAGFGEALRTIVDANLTSLIAALALFQFGSGPVKGFAVTHGLGIVTNMFTAVYFSRSLVSLWYDRFRPATLPL
ncbi:MAG: protein translocase subunit SecD [Geminicoccaceae bacterium]